MEPVSRAGFVLRTATYALLDKATWLDTLASRISRGSMNQDRLASRLVADMMHLGGAVLHQTPTFRDYDAELVAFGRSALLAETHQQFKDGAANFVRRLLASRDCQPWLQTVAASLTELPPPEVADHPLERVLTALSRQENGEAVLRMGLRNALAGVVGGRLLTAPLMSALKRAILDNGKYPPTFYGHHAAAWYLRRLLAPDDHSPLSPPVSAWLIASGGDLFRSLYRQKGLLYQRLGIQPAASDIGTLFVQGFPCTIKATADMTPAALTRLVLKAYVSGRLPALETSLATLPTSVGQAFRQQRDTLLAFIDRLPDAEITATAGLPDEITAVTAALAREIGPADKRPLDKHCGFPLPVKHPVMRGKWAVDPGFDRAWDEGMTLVIRPAEHELRLWVQKGVRAWHSAWQGAGGANVAPSCDDALARLSALVQGNALGLLAVTRLLNPAGIEQALGQRILSPFDGGQPDRICYQGLWLLSAKPTVSFEVSSEEGVNIDATLSWPIVRYGPRSRCDITPLETGGAATLSSTVQIHLAVTARGIEQPSVTLGPVRLLIREIWRNSVPQAPHAAAALPESGSPLVKMMGEID
ncbi:hypothetical protein [Sodalis praecaptivus]|uniref:hypothetical protein n=1 Tax=Sodalis praecaptivus TaxID=1239307 RepID=UPI0027E8BB2E|nr:hypothetical protein [Sodalis praecaptivus]CAJ0994565.1 hypothetical protein NVIRENTERO_01481 [Sodalis praecaptivus]